MGEACREALRVGFDRSIKLEFHDGIVETAGLDNVSITAVPEPGAGWLLLAGLPPLAGAARRKPAAPRV